MSNFKSELRRRAADVQHQLAEANRNGDHYLAEVLLGEMESLARLAAEHRVELPGVAESLTELGGRTPPPGLPIVLRPDAVRESC